MEFNLSQDQVILKNETKRFLRNECPMEFVKEMIEDEKGYSPSLWKKMAELGWMGLPFDERYGGLGGDFLDLSIILEEMGRSLLPAPFFSTVILSGLLLQDFSDHAMKEKYLPPIACGDSVATLALPVGAGYYSREGVGFLAENKGETYQISGIAFFVPYANICDIMLCAAKTIDNGNEKGLTVFMLDIKNADAQITPLKSFSADKLCEVVLNGQKVISNQIVGEIGKGWDYIEGIWPKIVTAKCVEMVGGIRQVLDLTVKYVNERRQFGRPLAGFQAIQHYCAEMAIKLEASRYISYQAAWRIKEGLSCRKEAAMAKAWCNEAFKEVMKVAHQAYGAIGFTNEYDLHLFTRHAKAWELSFGDVDFHREIVASCMGL